MAEQQTRPPDLSPTDLPQPFVAPAGCYTLFFPSRYDNDMLHGQRYSKQYGLSDNKEIFYGGVQSSRAKESLIGPSLGQPATRAPCIEDLLHGVWQTNHDQDPIAGLVTDRLNVQTLGLGDVLTQISERVSIYRQHFDELEHAKLDVRNVRKRWTDPMDKIGNLPDPDLVNAIHELESQQRQERLSCWKDLSTLRQQVPEHWQQYLSSVRQQEWAADSFAPPDSRPSPFPISHPTGRPLYGATTPRQWPQGDDK